MRSRRTWGCGAVAALLAVAGSVVFAVPASAHPTDETLQQAYVTPAASGLTVRLDLTPGVLVAPQFARSLDLDGDGALSPAEIDSHVAAVSSAVIAQVSGAPAALTLTARIYPSLDLLAAGGGVITLVWTAVLPADAQEAVFVDHYQPGGRTTVQMSVLVAPDAVPLGPIVHSEQGRALTVALNGAIAAAEDTASSPDAVSSGSAMFDALRHPLTSPWALLVLLGACVLLGALHALTPGHGKTLLAGYLVGARGTPRHALVLGLVTTLSHTAAVIALGVVVLVGGQYVAPGVVVPVLTVLAGLVVLVLGVRLVRLRWRTVPVDPHEHAVGHGHGHGHEGQLLTRPSLRSVAAMGVTAGIIPCPEALSVLLLAVGLQRTGLGLVMIVAFSVGLAAVLVALGLVLVAAPPAVSRITARIPGWVTTRLPLVSALVVTVLGAVMAVTGATGLAG